MDLVKEPEASELTHVRPPTLRKWRSKRTGPPWYQLGGAVFYERNELLEWMRQQRRVPDGQDAA